MIEARSMGDRYLEGTFHLKAGRRLWHRQNLLQAESILKAVGAEFDLTAAREALLDM